jgi:SAM-dependent methyltransferase
MPSPDSAPYSGDVKLDGKQSRAYFLYGWQEIKTNREPAGVQQLIPASPTAGDSRSPFRVYADSLMQQITAQHVPSPAAIIDIGCGQGLYAHLFKDFPGVYHGVDVVEYPQWEAVRQQAAAENWSLKVQFYQMPAEQLEQLDITANFSLSSSALEHVDDPQAVIAGLAKRSAPGSYGLHIVPAPWSLLSYGKHGWRRFSAERLKALFENAGFETVALYRLGGIPTTGLQYIWMMGLEEGLALQSVTLYALPSIIYRAASALRFQQVRTNRWTGAIYRVLLRASLKADRYLPWMVTGYGIVVRRKL